MRSAAWLLLLVVAGGCSTPPLAARRTAALDRARSLYEEAHQRALSENGRTEPRLSLLELASLQEAHARWAEARSAFTQASERDPLDVNAVLGLARTYHAEGLPRQAADLLEAETRRIPSSVELLLATGDAVLATRRPDLALEYYRRAAELAPADARTSASLATALLVAQRPLEAAALLLPQNPESLPAHLTLPAARTALLAGRPDWASRAVANHLLRQPQDGLAWLDLARARFLLGRRDAARDAVEEALRWRPGDPDAQTLSGHLHMLAGEREAALSEYLEAILHGADALALDPLIERLGESAPLVDSTEDDA